MSFYCIVKILSLQSHSFPVRRVWLQSPVHKQAQELAQARYFALLTTEDALE